jgi:hypothetical protein
MCIRVEFTLWESQGLAREEEKMPEEWVKLVAGLASLVEAVGGLRGDIRDGLSLLTRAVLVIVTDEVSMYDDADLRKVEASNLEALVKAYVKGEPLWD